MQVNQHQNCVCVVQSCCIYINKSRNENDNEKIPENGQINSQNKFVISV